MAQPTPYNRIFSFTAWQQDNPSSPLPGGSVDSEYNAIKVTTDQIRANLALIQRDDGALANGIVNVDQLGAGILVGFNAPTTWATSTSYQLASTVFQSGKFYKCQIAHVSGVFATDLAAGDWSLVADFTSITATLSELQATENTIASASTTLIGANSTFRVVISGVTTITAFDAITNRVRFVRFAGALTLTHNAVSLVLPQGANIVTQTGDFAIFSSDAFGNWTCNLFARPLFKDGASAAPSVTFASDTTTGLYKAGAGTLGLAAGGVSVATATSTLFTHATTTDAPAYTISGGQVWSTGDIKQTIKNVADAGWLMFDDSTLGDASSGATHTGVTYQALYTLLWNNISDTYAPVTGGRGGSAAADWSSHKKIALLKTLGRAFGMAGAGSGLTARVLGQTLGEEAHILSQAELPNVSFIIAAGQGSHPHTIGSYYVGTNASNTTAGGATSIPITATLGGSTDAATLPQMSAASGGSGTAHNTMQPTVFLNAMIKL